MKRFIFSVLAFMAVAMPAMADSQGSATGGTMGTQSTLAGCAYQSSPSTLSNNQQTGLRCGTDGALKVNVTGGTGGTVTANQGTPNAGGSQAWPVAQSIGTTFAPAQVALNSATATQVLASLATPSGRNVCNLDTAINIFIGPSTVTTSTGIKLLPGACWDASRTSAAIYAIAASSTPSASGVQY